MENTIKIINVLEYFFICIEVDNDILTVFKSYGRCFEWYWVSYWVVSKPGQEMKIVSCEPRLQLAPKVEQEHC